MGKALRRGDQSKRGYKTGTLMQFGLYNIYNSRNEGLKLVLMEMAQANRYLGILQETKLTDGVYNRKFAADSVITMDAPRPYRSGVLVFYCASPRLSEELLQHFGPNIVSFQLVEGERKSYIVKCHRP